MNFKKYLTEAIAKKIKWTDLTKGDDLHVVGSLSKNDFDGYVINNSNGKMALEIVTDSGKTSKTVSIKSVDDGKKVAEEHFKKHWLQK